MNASELKSSLHALIERIDDTAVLQAYLILLSRQAKSQQDFWENLDDETKSSINEGLTDFEMGRDSDFFEYMKVTYGVER